MYYANSATGAQLSQIAIKNNPTVNYDQLVIQPNTLSYNLYKLVFQVSMTYNNIYTSQAYSYFKLQPSGLVVLGIYGATGGTYQLALGLNQTFTLNPQKYSYDLDGIADFSKLNFTFYCQVIDNNLAYGYPQLYYNSDLDLLTIKNNYAQSAEVQTLFSQNKTQHSCFSSIGNFFLLTEIF